MNIVVSGSSGLVGTAAVPFLERQGHRVVRLVRTKNAGEKTVFWNPPGQGPDPAALEGVDAVVHLAGETIAARWTDKKKQAIRESRVEATRLLEESLSKMNHPPKVLISASAIGYYGNHDAEVLRETDPPGSDFLADVCRGWEAAAETASQKGIRVVRLRFGIILSTRGGALGKMLFPFRLGLGGRVADGRQYMSWVTLEDILHIIQFVLTQDALRGPVNAVAPTPVTNEEFTRALGRALRRPTPFPMPAFAARLAFGEMADALLIGGLRVQPAELLQNGYVFRYPDLERALRDLLTEKASC
jgi:uncharacterized protein